MDEAKLVDVLRMLLDQCADADSDDVEAGWPEELVGCETRSFEEDGVMSSNEGIILTLEDGSEFQLTVVRSR